MLRTRTLTVLGVLAVLAVALFAPLPFSGHSAPAAHTETVSTLTLTPVAHGVHLVWPSAPGVTSYEVERDGLTIAHTSTTSYTDSVPAAYYSSSHLYEVYALVGSGASSIGSDEAAPLP